MVIPFRPEWNDFIPFQPEWRAHSIPARIESSFHSSWNGMAIPFRPEWKGVIPFCLEWNGPLHAGRHGMGHFIPAGAN